MDTGQRNPMKRWCPQSLSAEKSDKWEGSYSFLCKISPALLLFFLCALSQSFLCQHPLWHPYRCFTLIYCQMWMQLCTDSLDNVFMSLISRCGVVASASVFFTFSVSRNGHWMVPDRTHSCLKMIPQILYLIGFGECVMSAKKSQGFTHKVAACVGWGFKWLMHYFYLLSVSQIGTFENADWFVRCVPIMWCAWAKSSTLVDTVLMQCEWWTNSKRGREAKCALLAWLGSLCS